MRRLAFHDVWLTQSWPVTKVSQALPISPALVTHLRVWLEVEESQA